MPKPVCQQNVIEWNWHIIHPKTHHYELQLSTKRKQFLKIKEDLEIMRIKYYQGQFLKKNF